VTDLPAVVNGQNVLTNDMAAGSQFYRLVGQ